MNLKVLGASGSDLPGHRLSSFLLDGKIVFDAGAVTSVLNLRKQQMIDHIFITHAHLDHIKDIPFLADNLILSGKKKTINLLSIKEVLKDLKSHLLNSRIWPDFTIIPDRKSSILKLRSIKEEESVALDGYRITAYRMNHTVNAVGYLVEKDNASFFYTGDTAPARQTWMKLSNKKLNVLIVEISFPNKMQELAIKTGHLTAELLFEDLKNSQLTIDRIFITHVKPFYRKWIEQDIKQYSSYKLKILNGGEVIKIV